MSTLLFLRDVARRPLEMGAVLPSGNALAEAMVTEAQIVPGHVVHELGAGSGSVTRAIVARNPDNRLYLVEPGEDLAGRLRVSFPGAIVQARRAEELREMAEELNMPPVDRVVSGLPWALWGWERQAAILDALLPLLSPHARLVTFHYVHSRMLGAVATTRALLEARFRSVTRSAPVWSNVPPAYVHIAEGPCCHGGIAPGVPSAELGAPSLDGRAAPAERAEPELRPRDSVRDPPVHPC